MKLEHLQQAVRLERELAEAQDAIVSAIEGLGVTLRGRYQNERMLDYVRPCVLEFLYAERYTVLKKLEAIGVDMGSSE